MNNNLLKVTSQSGISQIRGINRAGATGSGIPRHVTAVSSSVANASTGLTSTVTVLFQRDPSDTTFGGVTVWVKGYQGNQTPTQVAQAADSPVNFILTNTGEALSVIVQATGNGGAAPIGTAPTTGVSLPKSVSGGAGTTTTTTGPSKNIALTVPAELSVSGSPISTTVGGTFTVSKATQSANTIWSGPASGANAQPTFRTLLPADGAAGQINTADQGYFFPGSITIPTGGAASVTPANTADAAGTVYALSFVLPFRCTVRRVSIFLVSTQASQTFDVGIYSADGTTLLVHPATPFDVSTGGSTAKQASITGVVLDAGAYWLGWGAKTNSGASFAVVCENSLTSANLLALFNVDTVKKISKVSNTSTAGVLPSSLGTFGTAATGNALNYPILLLEP